MILSQIKNLLQNENNLSAAQIAAKTGYDKAVIIQALSTWVEKGKVTTVVKENPCAHCLSSCVSKTCAEEDIIYQWIEPS